MVESGYARIARIRAKELGTRIALAAFIGVSAWSMAPSIWPVIWFAAVVATQGLDWLAFRGLRRRPDEALTPVRKAACLFTVAVITAVYSSISVYLWTQGGQAGQLFALVQVAGGLLHVSLHMHHVRAVLIAAVAPHGLFFIGLPLWEAVFGGGQGVFVMVAGLLYLAHLVVAVRQTAHQTQALESAKAEAEAERARAEQASAAKSDFLAVITHEIRTPMNAVISAANLLRRTRLDSEQREHVGMLLDAGDILVGLLNDVLDFSKIEAGRLDLELAEVSVRDKMASMGRLWRPKAEAGGVRLFIDVEDSVPETVRMDPLRFQQIVFNLLSNAVKFTREGSVRASVDWRDSQLTISVADTGCGVAADRIDSIFEAFRQADAGITRRYGGTGLGLTISRRLARAMGGDLGVASVEGEGAVFTLRLSAPAVEAPQAPQSPEPMSVGALQGRSILAVDDHEVNRRILTLLLEPHGCRLTLANNGAEALKLAQSQLFDAVLMDMQMPVMDGLEATRRLRLEGVNRITPVVALTANAMDAHRAAWADVGVTDFLTKPIDPPLLAQTLANVCARDRVAEPEKAAADLVVA